VQELTSADEEEEFIIASMKADVDVVDIMGNRKSPTWLVQHSLKRCLHPGGASFGTSIGGGLRHNR